MRGLKATPQDSHALAKSYAQEPFVYVLPFGTLPQTRHVRGSNMTFIGVTADRVAGRAIIISALTLYEGASGQAVQNMNSDARLSGDRRARAGGAVSVNRSGR